MVTLNDTAIIKNLNTFAASVFTGNIDNPETMVRGLLNRNALISIYKHSPVIAKLMIFTGMIGACPAIALNMTMSSLGHGDLTKKIAPGLNQNDVEAVKAFMATDQATAEATFFAEFKTIISSEMNSDEAKETGFTFDCDELTARLDVELEPYFQHLAIIATYITCDYPIQSLVRGGALQYVNDLKLTDLVVKSALEYLAVRFGLASIHHVVSEVSKMPTTAEFAERRGRWIQSLQDELQSKKNVVVKTLISKASFTFGTKNGPQWFEPALMPNAVISHAFTC